MSEYLISDVGHTFVLVFLSKSLLLLKCYFGDTHVLSTLEMLNANRRSYVYACALFARAHFLTHLCTCKYKHAYAYTHVYAHSRTYTTLALHAFAYQNQHRDTRTYSLKRIYPRTNTHTRALARAPAHTPRTPARLPRQNVHTRYLNI